MTAQPLALTREITPAIARCELTHLARQPIDLAVANEQHRAYEHALETLGCRVRRLPADPSMADSVFIEDTAVVLDEIAIIARPGAESRRAETVEVAAALGTYRRLMHVTEPGTLDGGDVLVVGRMIYVGQTPRTNTAGIEQVAQYVESFRYTVHPVPVTGCLHLKSAVTAVAGHALLVNPAWVDANVFEGVELVAVHQAEPYAANALLVGDAVIYPAEFPETRRRLEQRGIRVVPVPASELAKAEGAVTCCSLIFTE